MKILGIDIGGSGIKGAVVDIARGRLITPRIRVKTPAPAEPTLVANAVADVVSAFGWKGPVGVGFPGIIRGQIACSAANLHPDFVGLNLATAFRKATGCAVHVVNDADAAGIAEMAYGAGKRKKGTVLLLTLGTGIGSALFRDGLLIPNTEFGHLQFKDTIAEKYAAASVRKARKLKWRAWSARLNKVLLHLDFLLSPDLFILGGGVSKRFEKIAPHLDDNLNVVPAHLLNEAGIVGAARAAAHGLRASQLRVRAFTPPPPENTGDDES